MTVRVAICIATFHRPQGLERLLSSLAAIELPAPPPDITVLVVNNDPEDPQPAAICDGFGEGFPYQLVCLAEAERGVSPPRNRALEHGSPDHDLIAFIDDDSVADPGWLASLLAVQQHTGADVVTGPVASIFQEPPPAWIVSGGFFARPSRPTGQSMRHAFTNNVLLRAALVRETGIRFEPHLGLIGGSDTHFFRRLRQRGGTIVWADDAVVEDLVLAERTTARWLIRRQERSGMNTAWIECDLRPMLVAWPLVLMRSLVWMGLGTWLFCAGVLVGRVPRVRGRCWFAWGRGLLLGLFGRARQEYLEER